MKTAALGGGAVGLGEMVLETVTVRGGGGT